MRNIFGLHSGDDFWALGQGFLLGEEKNFSPSLVQATRQAGVSHLVAASGANLHFITRPWQKLGLERWRHAFNVLCLGTVLVYVFGVGMSGSLWRASGMWLLTWIAGRLGRPVSMGYTLAAIIIGSFLLFPQWTESISIKLSSLAVVGLIVSQKTLPGEKFAQLLTQNEKGSITDQIVTGFWVSVFTGFYIVRSGFELQSIGLLGTLLLGVFVEPYAWLFLICIVLRLFAQSDLPGLFISMTAAEESLKFLFACFAWVLDRLTQLQSSWVGNVTAGWGMWLVGGLLALRAWRRAHANQQNQKRWELSE